METIRIACAGRVKIILDLSEKRGASAPLSFSSKFLLIFGLQKCIIKSQLRKNSASKAGKSRKGGGMEGMTNEQFQIFLKMVIQILKDDKVKEETIKKIEALLHQ